MVNFEKIIFMNYLCNICCWSELCVQVKSRSRISNGGNCRHGIPTPTYISPTVIINSLFSFFKPLSISGCIKVYLIRLSQHGSFLITSAWWSLSNINLLEKLCKYWIRVLTRHSISSLLHVNYDENISVYKHSVMLPLKNTVKYNVFISSSILYLTPSESNYRWLT